MSQSTFMPGDDQGKASLFIRFATKLPGLLATLGLQATDADIVQQGLDAARFRFLVDFGSDMQEAAQAWTATKDYERDGGATTPSGQTLPVLPLNFPAPVPPGIVPRFRALVKRVKACPGYTAAIGEILGIERPTRSPPPKCPATVRRRSCVAKRWIPAARKSNPPKAMPKRWTCIANATATRLPRF